MKKIIFIAFVLISSVTYGQTIRSLIGLNPTTSMPGYIYRDTALTLPYTPLGYLTNYGTFGSFYDTARASISLTTTGTSGAATYNSATGVLNIPQYTGGGSGWALTGNAITYGDFFGGTNNLNLLIKQNNKIKAKIDSVYGFMIDSTTFGRGASPGYNRGSLAIGDSNLIRNTTGIYNTAIGDSSMVKSTTGYQNTGVGGSALLNNTTGFNNVAVGFQSMGLGNNTGNDNVALGVQTLYNNTSGYKNFAVGSNALRANLGGHDNIAIGDLSQQSSTGTTYNISLGASSMNGASLSGVQNVAIGLSAMSGLSSGNNNTGIGPGVMSGGAISGAANAAIGLNSLNSNTSGGNNFGGGSNAGKYNTTASSQIFINSLDRSTYSGDQIQSPLYSQQSTTVASQINSINGKTGINTFNPTSYLQLTPGTAVANSSPLQFTYDSIATTAASGTGAVATLTFASQTSPPFVIGSQIVVTGVTPSGYNGTYTVTACTATTVSYSSATTGSQTVAGRIIQGQLMTTPQGGAMEYDGMRPYFTGKDGVRGIIALTFTGTAAPATTPSAVGDHFVDTTNKKEYVATGTSSSSDWTILN